MIGLIAAERAQHHEAGRAEAEEHDAASLRAVGKIEPPFVRLGRVLERPAALRPCPEEYRRQARDQKTGRDNISENSEIWILVTLRKVDPHQQREREERADGEHTANCADPVVEMRTRAG